MVRLLNFLRIKRTLLILYVVLMAPLQSVASSTTPFTHKKVLVVDDSYVDLIVKKHLAKTSLGIQDDQLDTATNAEEAIKQLKVARYDLILSDGYMGGEGKNVDTLLAYIKANINMKGSTTILLQSASIGEWQKKLDSHSDLELKFFEKGAISNKNLKSELSRYK